MKNRTLIKFSDTKIDCSGEFFHLVRPVIRSGRCSSCSIHHPLFIRSTHKKVPKNYGTRQPLSNDFFPVINKRATHTVISISGLPLYAKKIPAEKLNYANSFLLISNRKQQHPTTRAENTSALLGSYRSTEPNRHQSAQQHLQRIAVVVVVEGGEEIPKMHFSGFSHPKLIAAAALPHSQRRSGKQRAKKCMAWRGRWEKRENKSSEAQTNNSRDKRWEIIVLTSNVVLIEIVILRKRCNLVLPIRARSFQVRFWISNCRRLVGDLHDRERNYLVIL